jgi:hypothetical protein
MGNLDWKRGRFSINYETNEVEDALRGRVDEVGDYFSYYRFDLVDSQIDPVYDEAVGTGKQYKGPFRWPAWHVTHLNGPNENTTEGFYYNDTLHITGAVAQLEKLGLSQLDVDTGAYLKDRVVYPPNKAGSKVYRVTNIQVLGQVQERHTIIGIDCTQVKPDELVNDPEFARWSAQ